MTRLVFALMLAPALADVYMHNPRGSNDRNCERNVNRNNGNRMFDSQNNAKGGYACPRAVGDESTQNEDGEFSFNAGGIKTQSKKIYYYEGSMLPVEWTNQHGCGANSKVNCEIVLQYMCEDTADPQVSNFWPSTPGKTNAAAVGQQHFRGSATNAANSIAAPRDGIPTNDDDAATDTIPDNEDSAIPDNANDRRYGMHESFDAYALCQRTARNEGLYTADQRVRRNDARGTRQNPNGNRRGLECPEERDYYPHWAPSNWVDIAVMTNDADPDGTICEEPPCTSQRCTYYLENSFNKNAKGYCDVDSETGDADDKFNSNAWQNNQWYNNKKDCKAAGFTWYEVSLDELVKLDYPACGKTQFSRVNQLGNGMDETVQTSTNEDDAVPQGVNSNRMMWKVPEIPGTRSSGEGTYGTYFTGKNGKGMDDSYDSCTVRLRYNISTSDFAGWPEEAMADDHPWKYAMVTSANNSDGNDRRRRLQAGEGVTTPLYQDPYVYIGPGDDAAKGASFVSLATNTNQYARTFQDRSYKFAIKKRNTDAQLAADNDADTPFVPIMSDATIYNINVRGKRGNIVQTYPSVEYDFSPNALALDVDQYFHFQWQGSDYNPRRGCNDAEGGPPDPNDFDTAGNAGDNSRADRANIVMMNTMSANVPMNLLGYSEKTSTDNFAAKKALATATASDASPCADDDFGADACYEGLNRLAYLNQQSDGGSLALRNNADCLTEDELDDINDKNTRENHPLNCAKMNAKPFPYFDGGPMKASTPGKFPFFSTRNNNFSNRDMTGEICVKGVDADDNEVTCEVDAATGVLQDSNPWLSTYAELSIEDTPEQDPAKCNDEASLYGDFANNFGASSCLEDANGDASKEILATETVAVEQKDNDALGSGNRDACDKIFWTYQNLTKTEKYIALAIGLGIGGVCFACIANYIKNYCDRRRNKGKQFADGKDWKKSSTGTEVL